MSEPDGGGESGLALELPLAGRGTGGELRVDWDLAALRADVGEDDRAWRWRGEPPAGLVVRTLSSRLDDGRLLLFAAVRPSEVRGHGEEALAGAIVGAEGVERFEQVLLSTEYDASGAPTRIGLEAYAAAGEIPRRIAADARQHRRLELDGLSIERTLLELRTGSARGSATLDAASTAGRPS